MKNLKKKRKQVFLTSLTMFNAIFALTSVIAKNKNKATEGDRENMHYFYRVFKYVLSDSRMSE